MTGEIEHEWTTSRPRDHGDAGAAIGRGHREYVDELALISECEVILNAFFFFFIVKGFERHHGTHAAPSIRVDS